MTTTLPPIAHVALTVYDLQRSRTWYRRLVGADPVLDESAGAFYHVVFALGPTMLGLHAFPVQAGPGSSGNPVEAESFNERRPGLDHIASAARTGASSRNGRTASMSSASRTAASLTHTTALGCPSAILTGSRWSSSHRPCNARPTDAAKGMAASR